MNWCILIPLLVGAICAVLGYLLGKLLGGGNQDECNKKIAKLEADLESCKTSRMSLEGDLKTTKASLASSLTASAAPIVPVASEKPAVALVPFDVAAAKAVFGKKVKQDDLTIVEGIGPKIQQLFHNHDVKTWKALSECSVEKCQTVLNSGGERYKIHKPGTWPRQAKLAYEGKWQALSDWQDKLDGGK